MGKIKYLWRRVKRLNLKQLFITINKVHLKTKRAKILIFIDLIWCGFKYLAGYTDYYIFGMYALNKKQRATVLTRGKNNKYIKALSNPNYWHLVHNKNEFNERFATYIKRDWLLLNNNKNEFKVFIKKHTEFIAKPQSGTCGKGIEKIKVADFTTDELYKYLLKRQLIILEEVVKQHPVISKLHPYAVNTIRIVTITKDNNPYVVVAYLRVGNGKVVDNFNSGGMVVPVDIKTGFINKPAVSKDGNIYEQHPLTNVSFLDFQIPHWETIIALVKAAALEIPELKIMGWDLALTKEGPLIIEANQYPGHDIYQLPPHTEQGIGILPRFEEILKLD